MKIKDSSEAKVGRTDHKILKVVLIIVLIVITVSSLYAGFKMASIRNSPEFDLKEPSAYLFYSARQSASPDSTEPETVKEEFQDLYVVYIFGERQSVDILTVPSHSFFFSKKVNVSEVPPREMLGFINETLGLKVNRIYLVPLEKFVQLQGVKDFEELVSRLSKTGLRFFDYFIIGGRVTKLRPESNLTEPSLAKFYHAMRNLGINRYSLPTLTKKPLKITVAGKVYVRNYVNEDELEKLRQALSQGTAQQKEN